MSRLGGQGPDLVIHEATVEHHMLADAIRNKHSTITEAIEETAKMGAGFTILTHFLQLYSKMPALHEVPRHRKVGCKFELSVFLIHATCLQS